MGIREIVFFLSFIRSFFCYSSDTSSPNFFALSRSNSRLTAKKMKSSGVRKFPREADDNSQGRYSHMNSTLWRAFRVLQPFPSFHSRLISFLCFRSGRRVQCARIRPGYLDTRWFFLSFFYSKFASYSVRMTL